MRKSKDHSDQTRLALLYTLEKAQMRLSESQLARIMSETSVMNFFGLKTALQILCDGGQIEETPTFQGSMFALTEKGAQMISSLRTDLRLSVRETIDSYIKEHIADLRREADLPVSYTHVGEDKYRVQAQILSDEIPIFQLTMIVDSRREANVFVKNWKEKGPDIYQRILLELTV